MSTRLPQAIPVFGQINVHSGLCPDSCSLSLDCGRILSAVILANPNTIELFVRIATGQTVAAALVKSRKSASVIFTVTLDVLLPMVTIVLSQPDPGCFLYPEC